MKRILALVLASVMLLALASCGAREKMDMSQVKSIDDLSGAIIAAQSATFHVEAVDQIEGVQKQEYPDFTALFNALDSGAIDGYVAEEPTAYDVIEKNEGFNYVPLKNNDTGFKATDKETGIAVAFKTGSEMVAKVNAVIETISAEQRDTLMKQIVKLAADPDTDAGEAIAVTSDKTDTSNGTLRIAMECAYAPFNWTQQTNANGAVAIANKDGLYANGYDVQVAKYIAAELGMNLEVHSFEWDSLIPAVQSGTVDGIIAGMSPTDEREEEVDFTECYYNSNLVIIYKEA